MPALCKLVWVLSRGCRIATPDTAAAIRRLIDAANVVVNRSAVEARLALFSAGGDFADGVIAYEGTWLSAETFVSFDRKAVARLTVQGQVAHLLSKVGTGEGLKSPRQSRSTPTQPPDSA